VAAGATNAQNTLRIRACNGLTQNTATAIMSADE
jgi:hypothetical protein